jgi:hypothetical protein
VAAATCTFSSLVCCILGGGGVEALQSSIYKGWRSSWKYYQKCQLMMPNMSGPTMHIVWNWWHVQTYLWLGWWFSSRFLFVCGWFPNRSHSWFLHLWSTTIKLINPPDIPTRSCKITSRES